MDPISKGTREPEVKAGRKTILLAPLGQGKAFRVSKDRIVIGTVVSADVRLSGDGIAPIHAVIELGFDPATGAYAPAVYDLASESGVFVNGAKVVTAQLKNGDKITIGRHHLTFTLETPDAGSFAKSWVDDAFGRRLFVDPKEDFSSLLLEDSANVEEIFDYRPANKPALEVVTSFFGMILSVDHYVYRKSVSVGDALVTRSGEGFVLNLTSGMKGVMQRGGKLETFDQIRASTLSTGQGHPIAIEKNDFAKVTIGDVDYYLSYTAAPPRLKRQRVWEKDALFFKILSTSLALTALTVVALTNTNVPQNLDAEQIPDRLATILYQPEKYETHEAQIARPTPPAQDHVKPVEVKETKPKPRPQPTTKVEVRPHLTEQVKPPKELVHSGRKTPKGSKTSTVKHGSSVGQHRASEGAGAKAKGKEGQRGTKTARHQGAPQNAAARPSAGGGKGAGGGHSQVANQGNVDFMKGDLTKIENILEGSSQKLGKGGERIKGFGGFDTLGQGGLALQGGGRGGGGNAETTLGGLTNRGAGGGRVGTGMGAAGSGNGIIGGQSRVVIRSGGPEEAVVMGAIDADAVEAAMMAHKDEFRLCYEREINAENPKLAGRVGTSFVIGSSGRVNQAGVESTTLRHARTEQCILQVIKRIQFPIPRGGGVVQVTFPFKFTPVGS